MTGTGNLPGMSMIERVARVLCEQADRDPDEVCIGEGMATGQTWLGWEAFASDARKVIAAMREPSEGIISTRYPGWEAMIDAALAEKQQSGT